MTSDSDSQDEGYRLGGPIPGDVPLSVPPGTNLLVVGPPMVGKERMALQTLAEASRHDQASILVTTSVPVNKVERQYRKHTSTDDISHLRIIDATGIDADGTRRTHTVSSPADLTGIGIGITENAQDVGNSHVRLGLVSISTLLQYMDSERVFQFLHVLTNRVAQSGYLGVFTLDPEVYDDQTVNAIKSLFDAIVRLEETEDGDVSATFVE